MLKLKFSIPQVLEFLCLLCYNFNMILRKLEEELMNWMFEFISHYISPQPYLHMLILVYKTPLTCFAVAHEHNLLRQSTFVQDEYQALGAYARRLC